MPTNTNGETQTDPLNLARTADEIRTMTFEEYFSGGFMYKPPTQIDFNTAYDAIGTPTNQELTRVSSPLGENLGIVFASEAPDPVVTAEQAIDFDPDDTTGLVEQTMLDLIVMAEPLPSYAEDNTLENEVAPWDVSENGDTTDEPEQTTSTEQTRGQKLAGLARTVTKEAAPVVIGMGVRFAVKSSLAGVVGGPVLAGLAGGLGTAARTGAALQSGDTEMNLHVSEDIDKSGVSDIHERYVMKQKRRAEKGGKINRVLSIINAPEQWAVERIYKTEEREKQIDDQLMAMGIEIKPDEQGHAYLNTIDGRKLTDILQQANTRPENSDEPSQLDILIQRVAVQARLAKHSTSTMEGMRDLKKDLFLRACVIRRGEEEDKGNIKALYDTLEAAKNEFATKEKLATVGMVAGISAAKSAFKGAIGVALAESVMGMNIEDAIENGIEFVGDKFEFVSESLQEKTEQLVSLLGQLKESGAKLIKELTSREEIRKSLNSAIHLTRELKGVQAVQETIGNVQTLVAETAQSLEVETLGVEIPSGSTIGEELLTSLQNNGEGLNIWDEDSAELWGAMILENQDDGFFTDALEMAKSVGDEEWIQFAHEMGLDESTGHFDQAAIMSLVEKANSGDRAAFQKLYRMFHWVRAGDTIKIPTNIQSLMENGLTNFESASTIVPEVSNLPGTEEVTSIISEVPAATAPMAEAASIIQDTSQLEAEIFNETMLQADAKAQELLESIKRISGSDDPVADLLDKLEDSGDRIKSLEGVIGPVAEKIEELTEEIEDTYHDLGGIETLANAYFRVRGLIENEPEYLEQLSAMSGEPDDTVEDPTNVWPYIGLVVAGNKLNRWRKKRRARQASDTTNARTTPAPTVPTPVAPPTQPTPADGLPNIGDTINIGRSRYVLPAAQEAQSQTIQPDATVTTDDLTLLKRQESQLTAEEPTDAIVEKQPTTDTLLDNEVAADAERQKREKLAEQQRLADEAIEASYKERTRVLDEIRQKGVIPYYREVIEFKPIALDGVTTRKVPVTKVELIGTNDKMKYSDLKTIIENEVREEIAKKLTKENPGFDPNTDKAIIDSLIDSPVNKKAIRSRLESIISPELNMTEDEALKYPEEKRSRDMVLNFSRIDSNDE